MTKVEAQMVNVVLEPGEKVKITLRDADGEFTVSYGPSELTVESDLPDTEGRVGVIYNEQFGRKSRKK